MKGINCVRKGISSEEGSVKNLKERNKETKNLTGKLCKRVKYYERVEHAQISSSVSINCK